MDVQISEMDDLPFFYGTFKRKSDDDLMNHQISGGLFADKLKLTSIDWMMEFYQQ